MGELLTLRLEEKDKNALALASNLSELPISKVIIPFIEEGTRISLGSILLFHIDRSKVFNKRDLSNFTTMIMEPTRTGEGMIRRSPDEVRNLSPRVVWDFFDLISEARIVKRLEEVMEEISIGMDPSYVTPYFLRTLCFKMGEEYLSSGGSLERLDYQLASEIFYSTMLSDFYRYNAQGTERALTSQLYTHQGMMKDLSKEMVDRYFERTRQRKFQAIEMAAPAKKRGRPPKKNRKSRPPAKVVAKEISSKR